MYLDISPETITSVLKIAATGGIGLGIWIFKVIATSVKKMANDISEIKMQMCQMHERYDGIKEHVEEVKERVVTLEKYVYQNENKRKF